MSDIYGNPAMTVAERVPPRRGDPRSEPRRRLKSGRVVDSLGLAIVSGQRAPGSLLPTEAALSARLKISRASLRQGLHALALKGLVEGRPRGGAMGTGEARGDVLDPDVLRGIALSPPDPNFFMELLEVRVIFEPAAARIAAGRASTAQGLAIGE